MAKKSTKPPKRKALHAGVNALTALLHETRGRRGQASELVLQDSMPHLDDNEVLVFIVGQRRQVARSLRLPRPSVDLRDLQITADGAAFAAQELPSRPPGTPTPADVTAHEEALLRSGGFTVLPTDHKRASDVGTLEYLQLLSQTFSVEEAAKLLHVNASRVRQRLAHRQLFGVKDGRVWRLPKFQFSANRLIPGIDQVIRALPVGLHPVAVHRWFRLPHPDLESDLEPVAPLQWLESGRDAARVIELASLL